MSREELLRLYGEATFEAKVWMARISDYERQLVELANKPKDLEKPDKAGAA